MNSKAFSININPKSRVRKRERSAISEAKVVTKKTFPFIQESKQIID